MKPIRREEALAYHEKGRKGKIEVNATKPCSTQLDLALAYTPGVAEPCREIGKDPQASYTYTARGNLVAVVTNGSAVLGLGKIGPLAGKPVMEGKAILFKRFADIDVFDLELDSDDPEEIIRIIRALEPTFGGINLEDIKAPECFRIEEELVRTMKIPVFHDDQHGTAIISGAALINALELTGRTLPDCRIVFSGSGAAALACGRLYRKLGADPAKILYCDRHGVIYAGRKEGMNPYKELVAVETPLRTLKEALQDADVFVGLSTGGLLRPEMIRSMAERPIIFALANPEPEIGYEEARAARPDALVATGRSDFPNQVNNVLGFPSIFRGALDVRACAINDEMKIAAVHALAALAREGVPETVSSAYGGREFHFGPDYLIPKPFDPRVLLSVAPAVAGAAMESGAARAPIDDLEAYRESLQALLGKTYVVMRSVIHRACDAPKRIVFPEGHHPRILKACQTLIDQKIARPVLLGAAARIRAEIRQHGLDLPDIEIVDVVRDKRYPDYVGAFYDMRKRKGVSLDDARKLMANPNYFGTMMVHRGEADGLISGVSQRYRETLRPALQIVRTEEGIGRVSGLFLMIFKNRVLLFADTTVNIVPTSEELAEIAILSARLARRFNLEPRVAMLSYSNFGSVRDNRAEKVRRAVEIAQKEQPGLIIDGEVMADTAVNPELAKGLFPFSRLAGDANILIFPDLASGNIAYKLLQHLGGAEVVGPILMGLDKPIHVLQAGCSVNEIVHMTAVAVVDAQERESR
ncbi:MAG: NADP-dependent malic enzyme [Deltaproteobacteria bacterium]|nr:NADP-dependent malic enzyme [Deltaproteobacteria bacterium]